MVLASDTRTRRSRLNPLPTPPFPSGVSPLRANAQAFGVLAVFFAYLYGNAWLAGGPEARLGNPVLSVFITGALMLLLVTRVVRKDADWRASLALQSRPGLEALIYGGVGFATAYGVNLVLGVLYVGLRGAGIAGEVAHKAEWSSRLAELPLAWVLPLSMFVGFWEEIVFRGFLLGRLRVAFHEVEGSPRQRNARVMAVVLSGLLFGAGHGYQGLLGLVQTSSVGVVLGGLTVWRKSLWPAIVAHLAIDTFGLVLLKVLKPMLEEAAKKGLGH